MAVPSLPSVARFAHSAMSTEFELLLAGKDREYLQEAAQAVFFEIDRLEDILSRFDPRSDISQINRLKPGEVLRVGVETFECLELALRLKAETEGCFDIDFRSSHPRETVKPEVAADGFEVSVTGGMFLDLGGIGKGFAVDSAAELLREWGIERGLLHSGTSTALALGSPTGNSSGGPGWPVGVGGAWGCSEAPKRVFLKNMALSGSGTEIKGDHVIDPASGSPAQGHLAAWVCHPSAAVADALSTAFMVMDSSQVEAFCGRFPEVWALVICRSKKCTIFNRGVVPVEAVR
jgi:thiamine biosynthesis lipoprotein